jgi:hypothetical protein
MTCPAIKKSNGEVCGRPSKQGELCGIHKKLQSISTSTSISTIREAVSIDKFYTKPEIAKYCVDKTTSILPFSNFDIIMEPSAGNGVFFNLLPPNKRLGIDIEPEGEGIIKADFLTFEADKTAKYMVIGNLPFGRISSFAVYFFNKACEFASVIAFIVPRTFKKLSLQNKLNPYFHLVFSEDLPEGPCCFIPPSTRSGFAHSMSARCCFQIWERKAEPREIKPLPLTHSDFTFCKPNEADIAIRKVGSKTGEILTEISDFLTLTQCNWHFIKANIDKDELYRRFKNIDYSSASDTVNHKSIGKAEFISLYEEISA